MIDPVNKIGYMRLTGFTANTAPAMKAQLYNLEERGMKGLIVDLRNNSGGYLSTAAAVVDMFVDNGLIVKSQPRWGIANYERAKKRGTHPNYPLIVLINGSSASASEIVAGALQDVKFKRATLVGTRSYGKGSVQTIVPYSGEGSQLKYTMAYYHLPSNQRVKNRYEMVKQGRKDWGIAPDVEVDMTSEEIKKHREIQWSNDVLAKANHVDGKGKPVKRYTEQETIDGDPQMRVAIMVAKSKIIQTGGSVEFPEKVKPEKAVAEK
jgi:carboxyl-terminal processing protease